MLSKMTVAMVPRGATLLGVGVVPLNRTVIVWLSGLLVFSFEPMHWGAGVLRDHKQVNAIVNPVTC